MNLSLLECMCEFMCVIFLYNSCANAVNCMCVIPSGFMRAGMYVCMCVCMYGCM